MLSKKNKIKIKVLIKTIPIFSHSDFFRTAKHLHYSTESGYFFFFRVWFMKQLKWNIPEGLWIKKRPTVVRFLSSTWNGSFQCVMNWLQHVIKSYIFFIKPNAPFSHHQSNANPLGDIELLGNSKNFSIHKNF